MAEMEAHTGKAAADVTMPDPDPLGTHSPDLGGTTTLKSGSLFMVTQTSGDLPGHSARMGPHGLGLYGFGGARYRHVARRCGSPRVLVVGGQWSRPPAQVSIGMASTLVKVATASGPRATLRASGGVAGGSPGQAGGNVQEPILQRLGFAGD